MKKKKKSVPEDPSQVIGEGIMAQINKSNIIQYSPMSFEEMEKTLNGIFGKSKVPRDYNSTLNNKTKKKKIHEKIARRKAPWECNKK